MEQPDQAPRNNTYKYTSSISSSYFPLGLSIPSMPLMPIIIRIDD